MVEKDLIESGYWEFDVDGGYVFVRLQVSVETFWLFQMIEEIYFVAQEIYRFEEMPLDRFLGLFPRWDGRYCDLGGKVGNVVSISMGDLLLHFRF